MTAALLAAPFLILAGCGAYAASILASHDELACLRRALAIRVLIIAALAAITAIVITRVLLRAAVSWTWVTWHARQLAWRVTAPRRRRDVPALDPDGDPLDEDELVAFLTIALRWKRTAAGERSRT